MLLKSTIVGIIREAKLVENVVKINFHATVAEVVLNDYI